MSNSALMPYAPEDVNVPGFTVFTRTNPSIVDRSYDDTLSTWKVAVLRSNVSTYWAQSRDQVRIVTDVEYRPRHSPKRYCSAVRGVDCSYCEDGGRLQHVWRVGAIGTFQMILVYYEFGNDTAVKLAKLFGAPPWTAPLERDFRITRSPGPSRKQVWVNEFGPSGVTPHEEAARSLFAGAGFGANFQAGMWDQLRKRRPATAPPLLVGNGRSRYESATTARSIII